jgi:hypothetical protein
VNTKTLANHYAQLTAEERFRLIVAASDRGDEAERNRLSNASKRITFSNVDYAPFAQALKELAFLIFLELVEGAAMYRKTFERWYHAETTSIIAGKNGIPATEEKSVPIKDHLFSLYLFQGFMLRTQAAGWKLFCDRMGISPFGLWQYLPGFERLQSDLHMAEGTPDRPGAAFTLRGAVRWLNTVCPSEDSEVTEAKIVKAAGSADSIEATFRECVKSWGG